MNAKNIAKFFGIGEGKDIASLKTPKEAKSLYKTCSDKMKPAVMKKWKELTLSEISSLKTSRKIWALYWSCPRNMRPAVVKALHKL